MAAPPPFPDRRPELFGREPDLGALLARCRCEPPVAAGLTVVTGPPRMGKSWLLTELARRLSADLEYLVGYAEAGAGVNDLALYGVADAYRRWLPTAGYRDQARSLLDRHRESLIGAAGKAVADLLGSLVRGLPAVDLVPKLFSGLAELDRELKTGPPLPQLPYPQARELVSLLHRLAGKPVVLILDQWEQAPDLEREAAFAEGYLRHLDDWPPSHLFLAVRRDEEHGAALRRAREVAIGSPAAVEIELPPLHPEPRGGARLVAHLRGFLGDAAAALGDDELVALLAGVPGVIEWWRRAAAEGRLRDEDDLRREAADALTLRYREVHRGLAALADREPALLDAAIGLALLPPIASAEEWEPFRGLAALDEHEDRAVAALQQAGVLDRRTLAFPAFGHATRHEAARRWCLDEAAPAARAVALELVPALVARAWNAPHPPGPYVVAVAALSASLETLQAPPDIQLLAELAACLLLERPSPSLLAPDPPLAWLLERQPQALRLIFGAAVFSAHWARDEGDPEPPDRLLAEIEALAPRFSSEGVVWESLGWGLFDSLLQHLRLEDRAAAGRALDALRRLADARPEALGVHLNLARGVNAFLGDAEARGDQRERNRLFEELIAVAGGRRDDWETRTRLLMAVFNALNTRPGETKTADGDALLEEYLRRARELLADPGLRADMAQWLFEMFQEQGREGDREKCALLVKGLRWLATDYPDDRRVREPLAWTETLVAVKGGTAGDFERLRRLRGELATPKEAAIGEPTIRVLRAGEILLAEAIGAGDQAVAGRRALLDGGLSASELDELLAWAGRAQRPAAPD